MKRTTQRPRMTHADRAFRLALSRLWTGWQRALILVKPETVIRWHHKGFRLYLQYYHGCRTHLALDKDTPEPREHESIAGGKIIAIPMVGGLHHRYVRRVAA